MRNLVFLCLITACTADVDILSEDEDATEGASIVDNHFLSGCHGNASSAIPTNGKYTVTTFGGPGDHQSMSCGGFADGTGWYAASRQRYGCGAHIKLEANGKCVVLKTDDYGPDICVENAAHMPIIDVSPRATKELFGISGAGWSDHIQVTVTKVAASTPLGPCVPGGGGGGDPMPAASCASATLDRDVSSGTCVQSASDGQMYQCSSGNWVAKTGTTGCTSTYAFCNSATLGENVAPRTCVQSAASSVWFQCNGQAWAKPVDVATKTGPIGACSSWHPL